MSRAVVLEKLLRTSDALVYGSSFRVRRFRAFLRLVDEIAAHKPRVRVLDVGGLPEYWLGLESAWKDRPLEVTCVNMWAHPSSDPRIASVSGDACAMPELADGSFDVVHSNAVIEHVGDFAAKKKMAAEIRRLAPRYFVVTPNFWFPIETHYRMPFVHWLPEKTRISLLMRAQLGFYPRAANLDEAHHTLKDASLVDEREMRALFPDARIEHERLGPFVKSFVAIR